MNSDVIEKTTKGKFSGEQYDPQKISQRVSRQPQGFFEELLFQKIRLVREALPDAPFKLLDLCCGDGNHLRDLADKDNVFIGADFSLPALFAAREKCSAGTGTPSFVGANARELPFKNNCFDGIFCFSSLYYMPRLGNVLKEIFRVLKENGFCVLDLGNLFSVNTLVCAAYPELAFPCHVSVPKMLKEIKQAGLSVFSHQAFQILPYWGGRPWWLRCLLHPFWMRILQKKIGGKMLDQWLSSMPFTKMFAFRHLILCRKIEKET